MKIKKFMGKAIVVLAVSIGLGAVPAHATPRDGEKGKRDVIVDAKQICELPPPDLFLSRPVFSNNTNDADVQAFACLVLWKTDGMLEVDRMPCADKLGRGTSDNGVVIYSRRNCDKNEEALLRKMSSVVLSLNDVMRGKDHQRETAANYACSYATKVSALIAVGVGKLRYAVPEVGEDLVADAEAIASALGFPCPE